MHYEWDEDTPIQFVSSSKENPLYNDADTNSHVGSVDTIRFTHPPVLGFDYARVPDDAVSESIACGLHDATTDPASCNSHSDTDAVEMSSVMMMPSVCDANTTDVESSTPAHDGESNTPTQAVHRVSGVSLTASDDAVPNDSHAIVAAILRDIVSAAMQDRPVADAAPTPPTAPPLEYGVDLLFPMRHEFAALLAMTDGKDEYSSDPGSHVSLASDTPLSSGVDCDNLLVSREEDNIYDLARSHATPRASHLEGAYDLACVDPAAHRLGLHYIRPSEVATLTQRLTRENSHKTPCSQCTSPHLPLTGAPSHTHAPPLPPPRCLDADLLFAASDGAVYNMAAAFGDSILYDNTDGRDPPVASTASPTSEEHIYEYAFSVLDSNSVVDVLDVGSDVE